MQKPGQPPLKIALVCDWYLPRTGGIETHLKDLSIQLAQKGDRVHLITPIPSPGGNESRGPVTVLRVRSRLCPCFHFIVSRKGVDQLEDLLTTEQYDVVHCHFSYISPFAAAGITLAVKHGLPCVVTCHSFLGKFAAFLRLTDAAIGWTAWPVIFSAVSGEVAKELRRAGVSGQIPIIGNGIDTQLWQSLPRPTGSLVRLVTVMRLTRRKRGIPLMMILKQVKDILGPGAPFHLTLAGSGPDLNRIRKRLVHLGLETHVTLKGMLAHHQIKPLLDTADIFVLPTQLEAFGIAALEARCAGLAVVAMKKGGVKSFIQHGINGFLAENDAHMTALLCQLIRDKDTLDRMKHQNQTTPCTFSWDQILPQLEQIYHQARLTSGCPVNPRR